MRRSTLSAALLIGAVSFIFIGAPIAAAIASDRAPASYCEFDAG